MTDVVVLCIVVILSSILSAVRGKRGVDTNDSGMWRGC